METTTTPRTVEIFFQTDRNGRRVAYRWSRMQFRSFRIGLDEAELLIATELAIVLPGHPFPKVVR